jgi:hypothetical protein
MQEAEREKQEQKLREKKLEQLWKGVVGEALFKILRCASLLYRTHSADEHVKDMQSREAAESAAQKAREAEQRAIREAQIEEVWWC